MDDQIEYDALIEFQNKTIRSIIFPLLEKKYQTTLFKFYLHLIENQTNLRKTIMNWFVIPNIRHIGFRL
jgi:hypothetical protein